MNMAVFILSAVIVLGTAYILFRLFQKKAAERELEEKRLNRASETMDAAHRSIHGLSPRPEHVARIRAKEHLNGRYYDPLDMSLLTDPVDLAVNHPVKGPIKLKVNRRNAELYAKYGPGFFARKKKIARIPNSHRCFVRGGGYSGAYYNDGYDILDLAMFHMIFCDHGHNGMMVNDMGFMGGGGTGGGAGAGGDWYSYNNMSDRLAAQDTIHETEKSHLSQAVAVEGQSEPEQSIPDDEPDLPEASESDDCGSESGDSGGD